jgi:hypothetical protein
MSVQDRMSAVQGEYVRLPRTFLYNGDFYSFQAGSEPTVDIVRADGSVIMSSRATLERIGQYYVDWLVPVDQPLGRYYDRWNFTYPYPDDEPRSEMTYFDVALSDTFMNFSASTTSMEISDKMRSMVMALENDFIYETQHIPLYWEQLARTEDATKFNGAYRNWRRDPKPLVRMNGMLLFNGWIADYDGGNIFFASAPGEGDDVMVSYNFAYFSQSELIGFLQEGLRAMNAIPPASYTYNNIQQIPRHWEYGVLLVAAIHALRRIIMGLTIQEKSIIFGESREAADAAYQKFQQLYQDYSTLWLEISKGIKKTLPTMGVNVQPEFTLPGGRSRWFRYLYTTTVG